MHTISMILQHWFAKNMRKLPWRETRDPYLIWISETVLQQTRVNQGLEYYLRLVERFPDIQTLAAADQTDVLRLWQGLGYYSRARNLHFAANQIISDFSGIFPKHYNDVLTLKGIGTYTAAAICSFAYNQAVAVVDGNVFRVLARLFNEQTPIDSTEGKKLFAQLAAELLDKNNSSAHNQAMMEFGALQCVPQSPDCQKCVLQAHCLAFLQKTVQKLPVKLKKTQIRERFFNYIIIRYKNNLFIHKRTENDIWRGLYDFPLIEADMLFSKTELIENEYFKSLFADGNQHITVEIKSQSSTFKHILTHQRIFAQFFEVEISKITQIIENQFIIIKPEEISKFPLPRLMELFLQ